MKFTLRIPGRDEIEPASAAIPAIPLFLAGVQRAMVAAKLANLPQGANQHEGVPIGTASQSDAALQLR